MAMGAVDLDPLVIELTRASSKGVTAYGSTGAPLPPARIPNQIPS